MATLDFSSTGITGDFDNDPTTPDTPAASISVAYQSDAANADGEISIAGELYGASTLYHESDFTSDPSQVTRIIGTDIGDGFLLFHSPRNIHIDAGGGDDAATYGADNYVTPFYFDGGTGNNHIFMQAGMDAGNDITIDLTNTDINGYAAIQVTIPASLRPGYGTQTVGNIKNVTSIETWIYGGNDFINASNQTSNMTFFTWLGTDSAIGGSGNDTYKMWIGDKTFDGGAGVDTLDVWSGGGQYGLTIDLANIVAGYAHGTATWERSSVTSPATFHIRNVENVLGTADEARGDTIKGDAQANSLDGKQGNDWLEGRNGSDVLIGGVGNDTLYGGSSTAPGTEASGDVDTAVFTGNRAQYTVTSIVDANGIAGFSIADNRGYYDDDDTDRVFQVELFRFADGTVTAAELGGVTPPVNRAPVATDDAFATAEDVALTGGNVLGNDTDADGNALTAVLVAGPSHGTLTLNANGSFTYTPTANYNGTDSFTYKANDGTVDSGVATVNLTITPVNDAPDAVDNAGYTTAFNTVLNLAKATLLANDTDVDGDVLTVTSVSNASHGTVTISGNTVVFMPTTGYSGAAGFDYTISDGHGGTDTAHVSLTVNPQSTGGTTYNPLTNGDDTVSFANAAGPVLVGGLNGNDSITGSRFADTLNGGAGNDLLNGGAGKDVIIGGRGYDRVMGGADNDTFVFAAGDLSTTSQIDHIMDFYGAGIAQTGAGEQDFIRFTGFGTGATLQFDHYGNAAHTLQYYRVVDPANAANGGLILVQMAGGNTNQLISGDYHFY